MSVLRVMLVLAAATVLVGCAQPIPARMVYAPTIVDGCQNLGRASDTQYMRLANKAGELGGTHALILREVPRQHAWGVEEYVAEVYRCGTTVSQR